MTNRSRLPSLLCPALLCPWMAVRRELLCPALDWTTRTERRIRRDHSCPPSGGSTATTTPRNHDKNVNFPKKTMNRIRKNPRTQWSPLPPRRKMDSVHVMLMLPSQLPLCSYRWTCLGRWSLCRRCRRTWLHISPRIEGNIQWNRTLIDRKISGLPSVCTHLGNRERKSEDKDDDLLYCETENHHVTRQQKICPLVLTLAP